MSWVCVTLWCHGHGWHGCGCRFRIMYPCPYHDPFPQVRGLFMSMECLPGCPEAPNHRHFCQLPRVKKMSLAHDPLMPPPSLVSVSCSASACSGTSGSCAPSLPNLNLHQSAMRPPIPFQAMQPCHALFQVTQLCHNVSCAALDHTLCLFSQFSDLIIDLMAFFLLPH